MYLVHALQHVPALALWMRLIPQDRPLFREALADATMPQTR